MLNIEYYYDKLGVSIFSNVFTEEDLLRFNTYIDTLDKVPNMAQIKGTSERVLIEEYKKMLFVQVNDGLICEDVLEGIEFCANYANDNVYHFDIKEAGDEYQNRGFIVNDYSAGGFFSCHQGWDSISTNRFQKLACILLLSNEKEYEGGRLFLNSGQRKGMTKKAGTLFVFPSFILHDVERITEGFRRTIVCWMYGKESLK